MFKIKKLNTEIALNNNVNKTTQGLCACWRKLVKSTGSFPLGIPAGWGGAKLLVIIGWELPPADWLIGILKSSV